MNQQRAVAAVSVGVDLDRRDIGGLVLKDDAKVEKRTDVDRLDRVRRRNR